MIRKVAVKVVCAVPCWGWTVMVAEVARTGIEAETNAAAASVVEMTSLLSTRTG